MHLFYLDESGEREYSSPGRYFVVCAVGVPVARWKALNSAVLQLKKTYFGDVDVEIKSSWLRNPKERQRHYIEPYKITEDVLAEFVNRLYAEFLGEDIVIVAGVVDKDGMRSKYKTPQAPSSAAYRVAIERIELYLTALVDEYGLLIFDKITNLELKKKGYEDLLSRQHAQYLESGTDYLHIEHIVEGLLFIPSHENGLLQITDLCAYNVYRQFVLHGDEWGKPGFFEHTYDYFARIAPRLRSSKKGTVAGYGIKKLP